MKKGHAIIQRARVATDGTELAGLRIVYPSFGFDIKEIRLLQTQGGFITVCLVDESGKEHLIACDIQMQRTY